jgi:uncharacterized protein (TIGR02271 family)
MARTIVGVFDGREEAQRVVQELVDSGYSRDDISLMMRDTRRDTREARPTGEKREDRAAESAGIGALLGGAGGLLVGLGALAIPGIGPLVAAGPLAAALAGAGVGAGLGALVGALVGMGIPEEEAQHYSEAIRRGGVLVAVRSSDDMTERAVSIMERHNPIDIERRAAEWRAEGWTPSEITAREQRTVETQQPITSHTEREADFQEVEEELKVGKREVERSGARVSSRVVEEPVEEDITLREERVDVERRPVDRPASEKDLEAFEEGAVEFRERAEEPVVQKEAHVAEEVHVGKEVEERTETVRDTLRRVEVDVEPLGEMDRTTLERGFADRDDAFRSHYNTHFSGTGHTFDYYQPGYQYGWDLAHSRNYRSMDWSAIENDARMQWERHNANTWDQVKDAIHYGWQVARERTMERGMT